MSADSDPLLALEHWVAPLLAKLSPTERRGLARKIGRELRRTQAKRIEKQRNPDGSAYEPRKRRKQGKAGTQRGRIRERMFAKLVQMRFLRLETSEASAAVGFLGRASRIARVHQYGLREAIQPGGPQHQYFARELLGLTGADRERVKDSLLNHLADGERSGSA